MFGVLKVGFYEESVKKKINETEREKQKLKSDVSFFFRSMKIIFLLIYPFAVRPSVLSPLLPPTPDYSHSPHRKKTQPSISPVSIFPYPEFLSPPWLVLSQLALTK